MTKGICPNCDKYVDYTINNVEIKEDIRGIEVVVEGAEACCNECGIEIYVGEVEDKNIDLIDKKYRELVGIVQIEEISEILRKYCIGKKPLSLLLEWGENTIIRYLEGGTPTKQYSVVLSDLFNNPLMMKELLNKNKDKGIISKISYVKSMKAVDEILSASQSACSSLEKAIVFFLSKSDEITHLTLQKLLYNTQGWSIALTNNFIFVEDCQAWVHGPVYKEIYNKYSVYGSSPIPKVDFLNCELLDDEIYILEGVWKAYGGFNGKQLEKMSHSEMPWVKTRDGLRPEQGSDRIISKEYIKEYFDRVREKYNIVNVEFISEYSFVLAQKVGI
jgi:uncharacterized phage-associated protein